MGPGLAARSFPSLQARRPHDHLRGHIEDRTADDGVPKDVKFFSIVLAASLISTAAEVRKPAASTPRISWFPTGPTGARIRGGSDLPG